jgi:signal transduction histidine kinase/CheY-like chemotaxis protein/HPt (histidine-containing phosphotransfer) domain-containing protein
MAYLKKAFDDGGCVFEWMHQAPDGTPIPAELSLVRVAYEDGYAVAGYLRDLSEHKKMMREIEQRDEQLEAALKAAQDANDAKSDFLASMSHEMRTPLNAVIGLSGLSLEIDGLNEEARSNLEKVYSSGITLLSTVNDILDISKIEAGRFELMLNEYDIPSLINDAVTQNIMRIEDKPIEFILDIDESLPTRLYGDELRIKQIISNLLSNAFKYTKEGTVELSVRCDREGDFVRMTVAVRDTGPGIRPEDRDTLFTDYAQLRLESNRRIEGTGLGLPITKRLTEMMDGSISVESEYGKGSIFTARLRQKFVTDAPIGPEVVENLKSFRFSDNKRAANARLSRIKMPYARVLVVDDNANNLDVAKGMMKPYGMQIDCVTGGRQAVEAIAAEKAKYSAVFMDHMMPGMDGIEATTKIREIGTEYAKNLPVIALTANAIAGNEEMFLSKGFQAFLSKPIEISRLDEVLRHWVRDKEQEKSLSDRQIIMHGQPAPDMRSGKDRRGLMCRRSGIDRRAAKMKYAGLNMTRGIERFGGDEDSFLDVLRSYVVNTRPLLETMKGVGEDGLEGYAITIHGIKGSSRGICAEMLADSAEALENAAHAGDYAYVATHNATFLAAAWKLITDLEEMLDGMDLKNSKPIKDKPDDETLSKLLAACQNYDMDGVDSAMAKIESCRYKADDGLAAWLRENVDRVNFADIIEKLSA